mmetsp:Transcript_1859/g.2945  ORF Transcript_1859/g.2945 Transcript_1859/m.2945 type:complete len:329 (-) Transcript_1859:93-1079(-)|eukprot:CAMPEP_0185034728 /NCGR_PEP_ID=MMETSP1103-20130426/24852_1 /TAXON_ID=36769 /ORGANISM="Paraphysomonas bandaiensis, Strain Caron Lab Isolate" /LENGTH=328 /DNA_ID=CAMNT_0027571503 /DNA_START=116 /DNA_END=1102 /DNA_ORIENTATION=-
MHREITPLSTTCMKAIAKSPSNHVNKNYLTSSSFRAYPANLCDKVIQDLVDQITEAGRMTDNIIPVKAFTSQITVLSFKNSKVSSKYIMDVIERCPHLTKIDVSGCLLIDDSLLQRILQTCRELKTLTVTNCRKLTDSAIDHINQYGLNLYQISIGGNINITENGLLNLTSNHPNAAKLLELHMSGLPITDKVLDCIIKKCLSLRGISLGYAILGESTIRKFIDAIGQRLESLCISWITSFNASDSISADLLDHIAHTCPRLRRLEVSGLRNINVNAIQMLIENKRSQAELNPTEWHHLESISAKFISSSRNQVETLGNMFPDVAIEA